MSPQTPEELAKQNKIERDLQQLALSHDAMSAEVYAKNHELMECNKLLQTEITERKRMEVEILEITQAEQRRFGSQLHDGLCQELSAILVFAKSLAKKMEVNKILELAELKKISDMLLGAVDQARSTARGLYPGELEGTSLMHSLEELVHETKNVVCVFHCPEPIIIDDNNVATHLYRITQEGISNAIQHGKAQNIEVSFTQNTENITLAIKDDGIGMIPDFKSPKGIGLKIMRYRAHMMGATFEIQTIKPQGVVLECVLKRLKLKGDPLEPST